MEIRYSKKARKAISKMSFNTKEKIRNAIYGLTKSPPEGDIKSLSGYSNGEKRLRVGCYRVIFKYDRNNSIIVLFVIDIGPRGDIYK